MTFNVFGGTLNRAQSIILVIPESDHNAVPFDLDLWPLKPKLLAAHSVYELLRILPWLSIGTCCSLLDTRHCFKKLGVWWSCLCVCACRLSM